MRRKEPRDRGTGGAGRPRVIGMKSVSYYVGLDVHRQSVSYCIKRPEGTIVREGKIVAQRQALLEWVQSLSSVSWCGGLEPTICSHWIYHLLRPYAADLKMAAPFGCLRGQLMVRVLRNHMWSVANGYASVQMFMNHYGLTGQRIAPTCRSQLKHSVLE